MNLKQILTYSPLIGAFLIFLGALKLDIIYSYFEINIFNFLDFSEILTIFLKDINIILFSILLMTFHSVLGTEVFIKLIKISVNKTRLQPVNGNTIRRILNIKTNNTQTFILSVIFSAIGYFCLFHFKKTWILYLTVLFTIQIFIIILEFIQTRLSKFSDNAYLFIITMVAFFLFTLSLAGLEISKINSNQNKVTISTIDDTYNTDTKYVYVGKTDKYIFLHERNHTINMIIPTSQIKSLLFEY